MRAAVHGRVCVLDEADKAPVEVVVLLKALVEDGELLLGDGRTLLGGSALAAARRRGDGVLTPDIVPVHDAFRLWVLANRPGYPFSGNAFFREARHLERTLTLLLTLPLPLPLPLPVTLPLTLPLTLPSVVTHSPPSPLTTQTPPQSTPCSRTWPRPTTQPPMASSSPPSPPPSPS